MAREDTIQPSALTFILVIQCRKSYSGMVLFIDCSYPKAFNVEPYNEVLHLKYHVRW